MPTYRPRRPIAGRMSPLFAQEQIAEQERSFAEAREAARLRDEAPGRQGRSIRPRVSRKRAAVALIVIGLVVVAAMQLNSRARVNGDPWMEFYRQVDARTIAVSVSVSPRGWTRLTGVTETAAEVRVNIESFVFQLGAGTAEATTIEVPITLAQDLGSRVVMDDMGTPVPKR